MLRSAQREGTIDDADGLAAVGAVDVVVAAGAALGALTTFTAEAAEGRGNAPPKAGTAGATARTFVA